MPRPKTTKATPEQPTLHARLIPATAIEIDELQGVTFVGLNYPEAKKNLLSGLARRFPQGYEVVWEDV